MYAIKLAHAILEAVGRDALRATLVELELAEGVDKRSPDAMRARLRRARRATPERLLATLRVADMHRVCDLQGLTGHGATTLGPRCALP